jgi:capsular polysaccharide biosynthesis protein/MinD-like ATPase involved in chromosome partitioning or flagellar assembly
MIDSSRPDSFELSDYLGVLRRRWRTIVAYTLLGVLAAAAYIVVAPKAYTASSSVYVTTNAANTVELLGNKTTTEVNMDNEAAIVTSNSVATLARRTLRSTLTPYQLLQKIAVTVPANTEILHISCSESSPKGAAACAQAFAHAYLSARQSTAQAKVQAEIQADQAREKTLENRSVKLQALIASLKGASTQATADHEQLANISTQLSPLRTAIAGLGASNNYQAGYIITAASPPGSPSSPRKLLYGPSGLMAGLLIGLILAFLKDRRDDSIHAALDVERYVDVPVLFALPERTPNLQNMLVPPRAPAGRAFAELARAAAAALGDGSHVLLVVGASAGSGASVVAANLAAAFARIRADVVLVCTNPHDSPAPALLGIGPGGRRGFAELTTGAATTAEVAQPSNTVARLRVITPGMDAGAIEDVQYEAAKRTMTALKQDARYIVIDAGTAAVGISGLAEFADAAIVVAEVGNTRRREVADCVRRLDRIKTEVLGAAVLPRSRGRASKRTAAASDARPARRGDAEPHPAAPRQHRSAGGPQMPPPDVPPRAAADRDRPGPPGPDASRRARHGQPGADAGPADPRYPNQTWPLPRVSMQVPDGKPGSQPTDYPANYPAGPGMGES